MIKLHKLIEARTKLPYSTKLKETTELVAKLQKALEEARQAARDLVEHSNESANQLSGAMMSEYEANREAMSEYQDIKLTAKDNIVYSVNKIFDIGMKSIDGSMSELKKHLK